MQQKNQPAQNRPILSRLDLTLIGLFLKNNTKSLQEVRMHLLQWQIVVMYCFDARQCSKTTQSKESAALLAETMRKLSADDCFTKSNLLMQFAI